jgi:hypothetical protein
MARQIRCGRRTYTVNADGFCPALGAWIVYDPQGRLVTIPAS